MIFTKRFLQRDIYKEIQWNNKTSPFLSVLFGISSEAYTPGNSTLFPFFTLLLIGKIAHMY